jgi:hypothetical protein
LSALFLAAENGGDFSQALTQIWSDLRGLENSSYQRNSPGYLWSSEDRPPQTVVTGPVLIGGRVDVGDLRRGYFANRPIFQKITDEAEDWIEKVRDNREAGRKVNLLWIAGRSGTGKSVALLHILAGLHSQENDRTIIWLGNDVARLPECSRWARPLLKDGRQVLIGIDDPFPADREYDLAAILSATRLELSALQSGEQDFHPPLIICCGPTEQRLGFRQQFADLASITTVELPKESADDRAALWDWYQHRTGEKRSQPYSPEQDVLLVQLFFEWRTGLPIEDFAARFRQRIRQLDQNPSRSFERFMDLLFAVNRLYVNYPLQLVTKDHQLPGFETAFRLLHEEEKHLTIDEETDRTGIRITHPHLANAIYESSSWYPREPHYEPQRRSHLQTVIQRSIEDCAQPRDKLRVLWAITRLGDPTVDEMVRSRVDPATIAVLLHNITEMLQITFTAVPVYVLPVLVELQVRYPAAQFAFSPLQIAADALGRQEIDRLGVRLLCHKVLQHRDSLYKLDATATTRAVEAIRSMLHERFAWTEWPHIALDYRKTTADETIDPLIASWIASHPENARTAFFIQDVVSFTQSDAVLEAAISWLKHNHANSSAPYVLRGLLESYRESESLRLLASAWLDENDQNQVGWTFVWEALARVVQKDTALQDDLVAKGKTWLDRNESEQHPSWPGVMALAIRLAPSDISLRQTGWNWLKEVNHDHGGWTFIWEALERTTRQDWENRAELASIGVRWLRENQNGERHGAWSGVLSRLIFMLPGDLDLRYSGWRWMSVTHIGDPSWIWVWRAVEWTTREDSWSCRSELLEKGAKWLIHVPITDRAWSRIWELIVERPTEVVGDIVEVCERGRSWLDLYDAESKLPPSNWPNVLARLISLFPGDAELHERAWVWLNVSSIEHGAWPIVWTRLFDSTRGYNSWLHRSALLSLGRHWFTTRRTDWDATLWANILSRLLTGFSTDADLHAMAWNWLKDAGLNHNAGALVWNALVDATNPTWPHRDALLQMGQQWLVSHRTDYDDSQWPSMVLRLVRMLPADADLREAAWCWLDRVRFDHGAGLAVWMALVDTTKDDWPPREALLAIGRQWFAVHRTDYSAAEWTNIVSRLVGTLPVDVELISHADSWLEKSSPDHGNWQYLWNRLWKAANDDNARRTALTAKADNWFVRGDINRRGWPLVWRQLWAAAGADPERQRVLAKQADAWLTCADPNHAGWKSTWLLLWRAASEDADRRASLAGLAYTWLRKVDPGLDNWNWKDVWEILWTSATVQSDRREELSILALKWLNTFAPNQNGWRTVWFELWKNSVSDIARRSSLIALACRWLGTVDPNHPRWTSVWQVVWDATIDNLPVRLELGERADIWLEQNDVTHSGWPIIWQSLWEAAADNADRRESLWAFAFDRLANADQDHFGWPQLWLRLLDEVAHRADDRVTLLIQGRNWLQSNSARRGWFYVWQALLDSVDRDDSSRRELINRGWAWLAAAEPVHPGWPYVWQGLLENTNENVSLLVDRGRDWLSSDSPKKGWTIVWLSLWNLFAQQDEQMREIAKRLLLQCPPSDSHVIEDLLS